MTVVYASLGRFLRREHTSRTVSGPEIQKTAITCSSSAPSTRPASASVRIGVP